MKYSKQREIIIDYLKSVKTHPTAETVYEEVKKEDKKISLGTVYRNLDKLSDREKQIMELRFGLTTRGNEKTQKEVASILGISQSYISRLEKKIISRLKKEMKKFV